MHEEQNQRKNNGGAQVLMVDDEDFYPTTDRDEWAGLCGELAALSPDNLEKVREFVESLN